MAWTWGAKYVCGHETGGTVEGNVAYVTPVEVREVRYCPICKQPQPIVLTWGRGR